MKEKFKELKEKYSIAELIAIVFATVGIILMLFFTYSLWNNLKLVGKAQFGDLTGGVVGSLWAFAGILLFYSALRLQKNEFMLQRKEFKMQRIEFVLNRITQIIYKQKDLINLAYNNSKINYSRNKELEVIGRDAVSYISEEIKLFRNDADYSDLSEENKEIIDYGWKFVHTTEMEELLYTLYSSLKLIEGYIEDKHINENNGEEFVLSKIDKKHLYRLTSSTWNFNEMNQILFAIKSYKYFYEQEKVFGGFTLDKVKRISGMVNYSLELIKSIKREILNEVDTFARREALLNKHGHKKILYTG